MSENSIKERGTLRGIARSGLSPAVKHTKRASGNEKGLVVNMDTATKDNKTSVQHKLRAAIPKPKHHIAYDDDKLRL